MQAVPRPLELRLLLPLVILVPLGFAVTHIAQTGTLDIGPMGVAVGYVGLMLGAHVALRLVGNRGDQLLLPCVATIGAIGIIMLNRLPQQLLGTNVLGVQFGMATTQLLWFAVGVSAMVLLAGRFRDDLFYRISTITIHVPPLRDLFHDHPNITVRQAVVTGIDFDAREVELAGSDPLAYDYLVLATGSRPFVPPIKGTRKPGVFVFDMGQNIVGWCRLRVRRKCKAYQNEREEKEPAPKRQRASRISSA